MTQALLSCSAVQCPHRLTLPAPSLSRVGGRLLAIAVCLTIWPAIKASVLLLKRPVKHLQINYTAALMPVA